MLVVRETADGFVHRMLKRARTHARSPPANERMGARDADIQEV